MIFVPSCLRVQLTNYLCVSTYEITLHTAKINALFFAVSQKVVIFAWEK